MTLGLFRFDEKSSMKTYLIDPNPNFLRICKEYHSVFIQFFHVTRKTVAHTWISLTPKPKKALNTSNYRTHFLLSKTLSPTRSEQCSRRSQT